MEPENHIANMKTTVVISFCIHSLIYSFTYSIIYFIFFPFFFLDKQFTSPDGFVKLN